MPTVTHHSGNSCWILMKEAARRQLFIFVKITASNCGADIWTRVFSSVFLHAMERREERLHPNYGISECFQIFKLCIHLSCIHLLGWVWISQFFNLMAVFLPESPTASIWWNYKSGNWHTQLLKALKRYKSENFLIHLKHFEFHPQEESLSTFPQVLQARI